MMALRNLLKKSTPIVSLARNYSSGEKLIDVAVNDKTGIATVTMQRMPVNSLNSSLLTALGNTIDDLENNKARGMILTSASDTVFSAGLDIMEMYIPQPDKVKHFWVSLQDAWLKPFGSSFPTVAASDTVFSAGLDIMEMYKPQPDKVKHFWVSLQDAWLKLFGSSFPTVAVINGHSPAGGCLLALSCEYRIMLNNFTIGLNETQLGIVAPKWFIASMTNTISVREAELALSSGRLFKTDEALKIGMIDEIVGNKAEGLEKAGLFFKRFVKVHPLARQLTKMSCRKAALQDLMDSRDEDVQNFLFFVEQPKVQESLEKYIQALKQKKN